MGTSLGKYYLLLILIAAIAFGAFVYSYISMQQAEPLAQVPVPEVQQVITERKELNAKIGDSLLRDEPEDLQNYFSEKVANNVKDNFSKAAIYFITHRYFDNGGNIYEIVDYIEKDANLAFLTGASDIYPDIFKKIEQRQTLTKDERLLAYLAYIEMLQKSGYADAAAYGTAAAKYIELYDIKVASLKKGAQVPAEVGAFKEKALTFAAAAQPLVESFRDAMGEAGEDISKDDMLVGLSQYAVTLAFFKKHNIAFDSKYQYTDIFFFALQYATRHDLVLKPFTALNYDYALIMAGDDTKESIEAVGLGKILSDVYKKTEYKKNGLIDRMINGNAKGYNATGIYGKETMNKIIAHDTVFKAFMEARGYSAK
jgi:hypothetical protein